MGGHNWTVLFKFLENTGFIYRIWVLYSLLLLFINFLSPSWSSSDAQGVVKRSQSNEAEERAIFI